MTEFEAHRGAATERPADRRPYAASWVDHLGSWVERRPGPSWSYYAAIGLVMLLSLLIVFWIEGALQISGFWPGQAYLIGAVVYVLALIHHLDRRAIAALETLRPMLQADEDAYRQMRYQLANLPALPALLASLAVLAFVVTSEAIGQPYRPQGLVPYPLAAALARIIYFTCWFVFGAFLYHTAHQLKVINRIYTRHTRIDVFRPKSLYAFSNLAALTAGSLAMISYGWLLVNPWIDQSDPQVLVPMFALLLFAAFTFIWPQMGVHRLQVSEKDRLLDEATRPPADLKRQLRRFITKWIPAISTGSWI